MYRQERVEEVRTEQRIGDGNTKSTVLNNNLSELDTLLEDLNQARYSGFKGLYESPVLLVFSEPRVFLVFCGVGADFSPDV